MNRQLMLRRRPGSVVDSIVANQSDRISGMASYYTAKVKVERA